MPDDGVHITPARGPNSSNHSGPRVLISSYAASATNPDILYTLDIDTEVSQYMEEDLVAPSF